jgi:enoyl-CoA hydratase
MTTGDAVRVEIKGPVGIVVLDMPESLNILNSRTLDKLHDGLKECEKNGEIRSIVITGNRHFSAGADVRELKEKDPKQAEVFSRLGQSICNRIEGMRKPVIAAVSGYALGGGCEIALACDIRIASENARFGQPEVNLGIVPGFGGTQRLTRLAGIGKAKEMILTGRIIDAREAQLCGLVNTVVKDGELVKRAMELAELLAQKSPLALGTAKLLINGCREIEGGLQKEVASFAQCFASKDHLEGMTAFLEKKSRTAATGKLCAGKDRL